MRPARFFYASPAIKGVSKNNINYTIIAFDQIKLALFDDNHVCLAIEVNDGDYKYIKVGRWKPYNNDSYELNIKSEGVFFAIKIFEEYYNIVEGIPENPLEGKVVQTLIESKLE